MKYIVKLGKIFIKFIGILLAALIIINSYVYFNVNDKILEVDEIDKNYDCILILGCSVIGNNRPSAMLKDRLDRGIELYKNGVSNKLLLSGDNGTMEYNELSVMQKYAVENGVPKEDIFLDYAGFSTYDSIYRAKEIFQVENMVIVTQKYHLYRAMYTAKKLGMNADGVSSEGNNYKGQLGRDVREIFARCKDFIFVNLGLEPKFLGDKIPIFGDSNYIN